MSIFIKITKISIFLLLAGLALPAFAEKLTIINDRPEAEIFIDGRYVANKSVFNYEVDAGSHHVKVELKGKTVYSKVVEVDYGVVKTLNTSTFVNVARSPRRLPNRGPKELEAQRIREARGNIAIGAHLSSIPFGLSLKWFPTNKFGGQVVGWTSSQGNKRFDSFGGRLIYNVADALIFNQIMTFYAGVGAATNFDSTVAPSLRTEIVEYVLGIEVPTAKPARGGHNALANFALGMLGNMNNLFFHFEVAMENLTENGVPTSQGFRVNGGLHFYF